MYFPRLVVAAVVGHCNNVASDNFQLPREVNAHFHGRKKRRMVEGISGMAPNKESMGAVQDGNGPPADLEMQE